MPTRNRADGYLLTTEPGRIDIDRVRRMELDRRPVTVVTSKGQPRGAALTVRG